MKASQNALFEHAQRYIREVMAPRLKEEGFVSYKGEDIHWYRLVSNEVVQAVCFTTRHTVLPMLLSISFGYHPLFITPVFQKSPYMQCMPGNERLFCGYMIQKSANQYSYAPDILVTCPSDPEKGVDILEEVFAILNQAKTPLTCYKMHKVWRKEQIENDLYLDMTTQFVDEVLFWEDKELYPYCKKYILCMTEILKKAQETGKYYFKTHKEELGRLLAMNDVFSNREQYLQVLKEREQKTLQLLEKYTGIRRQD